jgi:mono/diheme cytochrome c family protein
MDGLIRNAKVCVDSNNNHACDAGEIQGSTDANGQVTLSIPTASLGAAKIIANVGTDAVDVDNGAVPTAFTMTAPATGGTTAVVSPLTTMVQSKMDTDKVSLEDAINYVKTQTGLTTASPMDNFIEKRASSAEHRKAGDVARLLVLSMQKSKTVAASTTATTATACLTGSTDSENERIKDSNINTSLSERLGDFRKTSDDLDDENEGDNDDNDSRKRTVAPVVPVCSTTTAATAPTTTTTTSASNGKALYAASCSSCHGADTSIGRSASSTLKAIASNKGGMGFLASTIGTQQAADIAAYAANPNAVTTTTTTTTTPTTTTPTTTTPTAPTTPTPTTTAPATPAVTTPVSTSATSGKAIYVASCAMCHGANPALNQSKILKGANSAITIQNAITNNVGGMGFLSSTIKATQAADLAAYLATPGI